MEEWSCSPPVLFPFEPPFSLVLFACRSPTVICFPRVKQPFQFAPPPFPSRGNGLGRVFFFISKVSKFFFWDRPWESCWRFPPSPILESAYNLGDPLVRCFFSAWLAKPLRLSTLRCPGISPPPDPLHINQPSAFVLCGWRSAFPKFLWVFFSSL